MERRGGEVRGAVEGGEQGDGQGGVGADHGQGCRQVPQLRNLIAQRKDAIAHLRGAFRGAIDELEKHRVSQHRAGA